MAVMSLYYTEYAGLGIPVDSAVALLTHNALSCAFSLISWVLINQTGHNIYIKIKLNYSAIEGYQVYHCW